MLATQTLPAVPRPSSSSLGEMARSGRPPRRLAAQAYERLLSSVRTRLETIDTVTGEPRFAAALLAGVEGRVFVRATDARRARWYRDLENGGVCAAWIDGHRIVFRATPVSDEALLLQVTQAYLDRFGYHRAMPSLLRPDAVASTFELTPIAERDPRPVPRAGR